MDGTSMTPASKSTSLNRAATGSPSSISPDALFGYGWLDGWYEATQRNIPAVRPPRCATAYIPPIKTSLPAHVALDPNEHPAVHVRVQDGLQRHLRNHAGSQFELGRTTYIGPQHIVDSQVASSSVTVDSNGTLQVTAPFSIDLPASVACPHDGYRQPPLATTSPGPRPTVNWSALLCSCTCKNHLPQPFTGR